MAAATIVLVREGLSLTVRPGQQVQFVAPGEFYEWTAPRDSTFALQALELYRDGIIGYQDYLDMTAAFRKK